mmetsp:Transcript_22597/g.38416  ORF Transcript_22597/g.38416 Transcript_22597/m.38416 type:complete len:80 (-) Transcript_22597:60-299(-)
MSMNKASSTLVLGGIYDSIRKEVDPAMASILSGVPFSSAPPQEICSHPARLPLLKQRYTSLHHPLGQDFHGISRTERIF